jgi:hypothetical protein
MAAAGKNDANTSAQLADIEKDLDKAKNDMERDELAVEGLGIGLISLRKSLTHAEFEETRGRAVKRISSIMAAKREERVNALVAEIVQIFDELRAEYAAAHSAILEFSTKGQERSTRNLQLLAERHANLIIHQLGDRLHLPSWLLDRDEMIRSRNKDIYSEALLVLDSAIQDLRELKPPEVDLQADEAAA